MIGNNTENGLEINGSELSSNWKILPFLSHDEQIMLENNPTFVVPGQIIQICHKKSGAMLTISEKILNNDNNINYPIFVPK